MISPFTGDGYVMPVEDVLDGWQRQPNEPATR
jgi:hypothetical protein